jgi:hypothetical protein
MVVRKTQPSSASRVAGSFRSGATPPPEEHELPEEQVDAEAQDEPGALTAPVEHAPEEIPLGEAEAACAIGITT